MPSPTHRINLADGLLEIEFDADDALDDFLEATEERGIWAQISESVEPGLLLRVVLSSPDYEVSLPSKVESVSESGPGSYATVLEVLDWSDLEEGDGEGEEGDDVEGANKEDATVEESRGRSSYFDVSKLNPSERIRLASRASRQERRILLRESSAAVAMALLSNPQIEAKEVLEIVKNPQAAAPVLQRIASDRRFSGNYEVQLALVRNPKTPTPVAIRLAERLNTKDLGVLAKSQALRENIRRAALRVYLSRTSQR